MLKKKVIGNSFKGRKCGLFLCPNIDVFLTCEGSFMGRVIAGKVIALRAIKSAPESEESVTDKGDINSVNLLIENEPDEIQDSPAQPIEEIETPELPVQDEPELEKEMEPNQSKKKVRYVVRRTAIRYGRRRR